MKHHKPIRLITLFTLLTAIPLFFGAPIQYMRGANLVATNGLSVSGQVTDDGGNGVEGVTIFRN